ncbi:MAG: PspC domain-containing protein [Bacteroidetes bacterium]|nr:PspC domain-containing protein [Bacteroidota bacterium]
MKRRLERKEPMILGVCSGLAEYFSVDPTIVRLIFIVAFFGFGTGLLVYIVLAILMPKGTI